MACSVGGTGKVPSLPPPRPKSPPEYPDLYGKRRELAKVQMLEREIGFLEDELKFVAGLQPASKSCKEVAEFVTANSDPLTPTTKRVRKSCWLWRWLCGSSCVGFSSTCCRSCVPKLKMPSCCAWNPCKCISCSCISCTKPACPSGCSCGEYQCCCGKPSCSSSCCCNTPKCPSCSTNCCFPNPCTSSCAPKCPKINLCSCSCCTKTCCYNCCYICC